MRDHPSLPPPPSPPPPPPQPSTRNQRIGLTALLEKPNSVLPSIASIHQVSRDERCAGFGASASTGAGVGGYVGREDSIEDHHQRQHQCYAYPQEHSRFQQPPSDDHGQLPLRRPVLTSDDHWPPSDPSPAPAVAWGRHSQRPASDHDRDRPGRLSAVAGHTITRFAASGDNRVIAGNERGPRPGPLVPNHIPTAPSPPLPADNADVQRVGDGTRPGGPYSSDGAHWRNPHSYRYPPAHATREAYPAPRWTTDGRRPPPPPCPAPHHGYEPPYPPEPYPTERHPAQMSPEPYPAPRHPAPIPQEPYLHDHGAPPVQGWSRSPHVSYDSYALRYAESRYSYHDPRPHMDKHQYPPPPPPPGYPPPPPGYPHSSYAASAANPPSPPIRGRSVGHAARQRPMSATSTSFSERDAHTALSAPSAHDGHEEFAVAANDDEDDLDVNGKPRREYVAFDEVAYELMVRALRSDGGLPEFPVPQAEAISKGTILLLGWESVYPRNGSPPGRPHSQEVDPLEEPARRAT
ncbi:hypothetical protein BC828DRAFT_399918 [Blastocladiella britannica]|nr:hypothetical protein BC828DRAFT_399918 [Blastocladiella britannica]